MHKPKISVALCTYNGEHYIAQQLASILNQSVFPDEIIICDDQSTDDTLAAIEKFIAESHAPVRLYINPENLRVKKNFEKAIGLCTGDLIFLADQDDLWEYEKVRTIIEYFDTHPGKNMVFTNGYILNGDERTGATIWDKVKMTDELRKQLQQPLAMLSFLVNERNLATGATMAMRSSVVKTFLPFGDLRDRLHDYLLAAQAAAEGSLGFLDDCLIAYRIHEAQQVGFNEVVIPPHWKPFYNIPVIGIKSIIAYKVRRERKKLATYLIRFTKDSQPEMRSFLKNYHP